MSRYSIGQVAEAAGLAPSALRYYERIGLLPRPTRYGGHRRYSSDVFARLAIIQLCKQLGFDLTEVKTVVDGMTKGDRSTRRFRRLATEKLPGVEEAIAKAELVRDLLQKAAACQCLTLDECAARAAEAGLLACPPPSTRSP